MKGLIAAIGLVVMVGLPPAARAQGDELDESLFDFDEVRGWTSRGTWDFSAG
jgi:hypothetical protein